MCIEFGLSVKQSAKIRCLCLIVGDKIDEVSFYLIITENMVLHLIQSSLLKLLTRVEFGG